MDKNEGNYEIGDIHYYKNIICMVCTKYKNHAVSFLLIYLCTQIKMCMHASNNARSELAP